MGTTGQSIVSLVSACSRMTSCARPRVSRQGPIAAPLRPTLPRSSVSPRRSAFWPEDLAPRQRERDSRRPREAREPRPGCRRAGAMSSVRIGDAEGDLRDRKARVERLDVRSPEEVIGAAIGCRQGRPFAGRIPSLRRCQPASRDSHQPQLSLTSPWRGSRRNRRCRAGRLQRKKSTSMIAPRAPAFFRQRKPPDRPAFSGSAFAR